VLIAFLRQNHFKLFLYTVFVNDKVSSFSVQHIW